MNETDKKGMIEAVEWARGCNPEKESIPKVGAVIAIEGEVLGRGRRGTGIEGDDDHAEMKALRDVSDPSRLPQATLYTTLEPCTKEVRTDGLLCCTELILQHKIRRVFVGMLDPNQGVTGKGLWRLQDNGVEVALFPHELAQQIRVLNAPFIRSQQTLGATILSPTNGETLETYKTQGKHAIRFKCLNPPSANNCLLAFREGVCWPQLSSFRHIEDDIWEIDAHFGSSGDHTLHIVTANELGQTLVGYYQKVINSNIDRRKRIVGSLNQEQVNQLGGDYLGISMIGLPKGFRSEAAVTVTVIGRAPTS